MRWFVIISAVLGIGFLVKGFWIPLKAYAAYGLMEQAYQDGLEAGAPQKPWPWADFRVSGQLELDGETIPVLDRATDQALAFGAGRHEETGTLVLSGHRDTHFSLLEMVKPGDSVLYRDLTGPHRFVFQDRNIIDLKTDRIAAPSSDEIMLLTCWPFDQLSPQTSQRLVLLGHAA